MSEVRTIRRRRDGIPWWVTIVFLAALPVYAGMAVLLIGLVLGATIAIIERLYFTAMLCSVVAVGVGLMIIQLTRYLQPLEDVTNWRARWDSSICPSCAYDVGHSKSDVCSECGCRLYDGVS